ncbi:MAG: hypothetical protein QXT53_03835 [Ignisphaera sp.]
MGKIQFKIEDTRSNTGKHRRIAKIFIVNDKGDIVPPKITNSWKCRGLYTRGESRCANIDLENGFFAVLLELTINWRKKVRGYISIVNHDGLELLKTKYVNGKLRYVSGKKDMINLISNVLKNIEAELK